MLMTSVVFISRLKLVSTIKRRGAQHIQNSPQKTGIFLIFSHYLFLTQKTRGGWGRRWGAKMSLEGLWTLLKLYFAALLIVPITMCSFVLPPLNSPEQEHVSEGRRELLIEGGGYRVYRPVMVTEMVVVAIAPPPTIWYDQNRQMLFLPFYNCFLPHFSPLLCCPTTGRLSFLMKGTLGFVVPKAMADIVKHCPVDFNCHSALQIGG